MIVEVSELRFSYPGDNQEVLRGIGFEVAQGEVFGLLGPSGAGKSTTQKILMGLIRGYSGTARLFGVPVASMARDLYERIGVSFELPALYLRLTAEENLRLFAALYDRRCHAPEEILELVGLAPAAKQRVDTFSKGMKMRLNLARSLLHNPDLLFLDEPTTGQDPARARLTRDLIKRLKEEGKTVFITTHNMAEAEEVCDRVAFLSGGRIPVAGKPSDLRRQYGQPFIEVGVDSGNGIEKTRFPMDGLGSNGRFIELLGTGKVVSLHTLEASLDDVFIRATRNVEKGDGAQWRPA